MTRPFTALALVASTLLAASLAACAYRTRERVVTGADLRQPDRTRITNYLSAPRRPGQPTERTPSEISRAALIDEAILTRYDAHQACLSITLRTHVSLDSPLTEWEISVNGQRAYADGERVTVRDHDFRGEREILVATAVTAELFGSLRLTEPADYVYRVVEREAHVCAAHPPRGAPATVRLELVLPQDDHRGSWGEVFVWKIRRG